MNIFFHTLLSLTFLFCTSLYSETVVHEEAADLSHETTVATMHPLSWAQLSKKAQTYFKENLFDEFKKNNDQELNQKIILFINNAADAIDSIRLVFSDFYKQALKIAFDVFINNKRSLVNQIKILYNQNLKEETNAILDLHIDFTKCILSVSESAKESKHIRSSFYLSAAVLEMIGKFLIGYFPHFENEYINNFFELYDKSPVENLLSKFPTNISMQKEKYLEERYSNSLLFPAKRIATLQSSFISLIVYTAPIIIAFSSDHKELRKLLGDESAAIELLALERIHSIFNMLNAYLPYPLINNFKFAPLEPEKKYFKVNCYLNHITAEIVCVLGLDKEIQFSQEDINKGNLRFVALCERDAFYCIKNILDFTHQDTFGVNVLILKYLQFLESNAEFLNPIIHKIFEHGSSKEIEEFIFLLAYYQDKIIKEHTAEKEDEAGEQPWEEVKQFLLYLKLNFSNKQQ